MYALFKDGKQITKPMKLGDAFYELIKLHSTKGYTIEEVKE